MTDNAPGDALTPARLEELTRAACVLNGPLSVVVQLDGNVRIDDAIDDAPLASMRQGPKEQEANARAIVAIVNAAPALLAAARERETLRIDVEGWRGKWNATLDREARCLAEIATLTAERDGLRGDLALIEERRQPLTVDTETDNADPAVVRLALLQCLRAWEPAVRVLGNVRACDAERAIIDAQDRIAELERERGADTPGGALTNVLDYLRLLDPTVRAANAPEYLERLLTLLGPTAGGADLLSPEERANVNGLLNEMLEADWFGTEGQNDPRGDQRG